MSKLSHIKRTLERSIKAVTLNPSVGIGKESMGIKMDSNGRCRITDENNEMIIELGEAWGGKGTTPTPGFYVRASLGACIAQAYYVWAAYMEIPIDRVKVELLTSYDMRGNLGIDESVPARYTECRYVVDITSSASRENIEAMIEKAEKGDFVLDIFRGQVQMERELRIHKPEDN